MQKKRVEEIKDLILPLLDRYGIKKAALFGSVARGKTPLRAT